MADNPAKILIVDDEQDICDLVSDILQDEGYEVAVAYNGAEANALKESTDPDLILLDIWMPDIDGISLLKSWREAGNMAPVIMMSGHGTLEHAIEATKLGASDFLEKPLTLAKLLMVVDKTLTEAPALLAESIEPILPTEKPYPFEPVGRSLVAQNLRNNLQKSASVSHANILLLGEPGTEIDGVASYIHDLSPERKGAFLEFNLSTMNDTLFNSTFFDPSGKISPQIIQHGNGGILYFKEIDEASTAIQTALAKLLNALATERKTSSAIQLRAIFSADAYLPYLVEQEEFSSELWHLLNEVTIQLPSLRLHPEDVPELINAYVHYFVEEKHLNYRHFSIAAQNRLRNHEWTGNHQELKNLIKRLLILGSQDEVSLDEVNAELEKQILEAPKKADEHTYSLPLDLPLREAREQFERAYLIAQYERVDGNMANLAKLVGMERTNLYRKLKSLDIDPKTGK